MKEFAQVLKKKNGYKERMRVLSGKIHKQNTRNSLTTHSERQTGGRNSILFSAGKLSNLRKNLLVKFSHAKLLVQIVKTVRGKKFTIAVNREDIYYRQQYSLVCSLTHKIHVSHLF